MKVKIQQFLGTNHSWSIVGQNIARGLIKLGHEVDLISTNGYDKFPEDLKKYIVANPINKYDMQISYTAMRNFPLFLKNGDNNRFGIWNYETTVVPAGFIKYHVYTDKFCPSSKFAADIFINNGVPKDKTIVIPHGINIEEYQNKEIYELKTKKKVKILSNIAQPHIRKNINGMLEAYGRAFNKNDDVCLICKVHAKKLNDNPSISVKSKRAANVLNKRKQKENKDQKDERRMEFDVDFWKIFNEFKSKYPNHAEIEIITDFLPTMVPLYNAVDVVFTTTHAECWWLPGIEGFATNNVVIAPNWGGQLEFMNEDNSLLISGKEVRASKEMQYWSASPYAAMFQPDIDDAVAKLRLCYESKDELLNKFKNGMEEMVNKFTWTNVAQQFVELAS